jgi:hypothetical protein
LNSTPTAKKKRKKRSEWERRLVYAKTGGRCFYCWDQIDFLYELVCDHYIPLSKQGIDDHSNLVPACKFCDQRKGHRLPTAILCDTLKKWKHGYFKINPIPLPDAGEHIIPASHVEKRRAEKHYKNRKAIRRASDKLTGFIPNPVLPWNVLGNHTERLYGLRRDDQCTEARTATGTEPEPGGDEARGLHACCTINCSGSTTQPGDYRGGGEA